MPEVTRLCCSECQRDCKEGPEVEEGIVFCLPRCNLDCTYQGDGKCTAKWSFMDKDSDSELITCYFLGHWEDGTFVFTDAEHLVGYIEAEVGGMDADGYDAEDIDDAEADLKAIKEWLKVAKPGDVEGFRLYGAGVHVIPRGFVERAPVFDG